MLFRTTWRHHAQGNPPMRLGRASGHQDPIHVALAGVLEAVGADVLVAEGHERDRRGRGHPEVLHRGHGLEAALRDHEVQRPPPPRLRAEPPLVPLPETLAPGDREDGAVACLGAEGEVDLALVHPVEVGLCDAGAVGVVDDILVEYGFVGLGDVVLQHGRTRVRSHVVDFDDLFLHSVAHRVHAVAKLKVVLVQRELLNILRELHAALASDGRVQAHVKAAFPVVSPPEDCPVPRRIRPCAQVAPATWGRDVERIAKHDHWALSDERLVH
mmetsp:Transcript_6243/g.19433  ORF Transcript_6243/g.19433 Transcript_6243/m.19433 type:complete len:271 (-) Transcript_6243:696-1508(-)